MLTTGMQNLPEPLPRRPAAYHDGTARRPRGHLLAWSG